MKKLLIVLLAALLCVSCLASCDKKEEGPKKDADGNIIITVGASPAPHAEILNFAKDKMKEKGYALVVKEYTDYVVPNIALEDGDIDANYFQHKPYLDNFNTEKGTHLVSVGAVHYEPFGIYAGKTKSIKDLKDGATVAIPNDSTNRARALFLLQQEGLIKIKGDSLTVNKTDIVENPKNLKIQEMEAVTLPTVVNDVDMAVINGNYAIKGNLKLEDALALEDADSFGAKNYGNVIAVKEGRENDEGIKALLEILKSPASAEFMAKTYGKAVIPSK